MGEQRTWLGGRRRCRRRSVDVVRTGATPATGSAAPSIIRIAWALAWLVPLSAAAIEPDTAAPPVAPPSGDAAAGHGAALAVPGIADGGAVAVAAVSQRLEGNTLEETGVSRSAVLDSAGNLTQGIQGINQSAGDLDSQANVISIAAGAGGTALSVAVEQVSQGNRARVVDSGPRQAVIDNSFNGASGIAAVNQSAGLMNQQANVIVVALGLAIDPATQAVSDQALGRIGGAADNAVAEEGTIGPVETRIAGSFNGFNGIAVVSQTTGALNQTANVVGVSVRTLGVP
jgi:hypothetical protein